MDAQTELMISQVRHATALLQGRLQRMEQVVAHQQALQEQRLRQLEGLMADHEARLRTATEGVTQFKLFSGLASGGSGLMSLVALFKAFLGG